MNLFPSVDVQAPQAAAMARALYALAAVDGTHPSELLLIEAFYRDVLPDSGVPAAISPADLAAALSGADERLLFVKTALMLAHVHGRVSEPEARLLRAYATALDVAPVELLAMEYALLQQLEHSVDTTVRPAP